MVWIGREDISGGETKAIPADLRNWLGAGEAIAGSPVATLIRLDTGAAAGVVTGPVAVGSVVQATVSGCDPAVGWYRLRFAVATNAGQTLDADVVVACTT